MILPNQETVEKIIMERAAENPDREVCGFLLTDGANIAETYFGIGSRHGSIMPLRIPLDHTAANCCRTELVKRGVRVQKMLPCRKGMPFLISYHSHPNGDILPSKEDIKKYLFSSYMFGLTLLNFGNGLHRLRCFEVICSPDGRFNWWKMKKIKTKL